MEVSPARQGKPLCHRQLPQVSLAEARTAREKARALVKQGIHPAHERQQVKQRNLEALAERKRARESSFAKVAQAYLAEIKPVFAHSSYRTKESRIRKYLSPKFDGMPMSDIGVKQIRPLLEECKAHGAWAAIHVKGDLSAIFEFAVVRGLVEANPIPSLRGLLRVPASESKAAMTREQIQKFYQALRGYRGYPETALCLRLIALTACRPGEAADAEWEEFDFEDAVWRQPAAKMKARRDHISPLSMQAIAVLKDLQRITGGGRYLFPHRSGKGCVFRPIVTAHSEKGVTGDSEVVTGDSDLIVTDLGRRRNHRSRCRNRRSRSNRNGLCGQRGNHPCHGYPRALCAERRDAGGADCHAQHQGAVTAQVRLRALA